MKRAIRMFGLSLVPAMALAVLFTACGDDSGSNGDENESVVTVPSDIKLADGNKVVCAEDMEGVVAATADAGYHKCHDGRWEKISRTEALKADKIIGEDDEEPDEDPDVTTDPVPGSNSSSGEEEVSSPSVTPDPVPGSNSSSSEGDEGASDELYYCDANGDLYVNSEECPSYVGSSASESDEGSSPSVDPGTDPDVTPDPVPGSNSSSSEGGVAVVMPDGYYSNRSNCPADLDCKYATTDEYLNSTKTYGEILDARDGQVYKTIEICDDKEENCQTWMAQNLNYAYTGVAFDNGYYTSDSTSWCGGGSGTIAGDCSIYGRLYTWAAAMDSAGIVDPSGAGNGCGYGVYCDAASSATKVRGVCPSGWHLPSNAEWSALYTNVGGTSSAGQKLKANTNLWYSNTGTDEYGFSVLPAGDRHGNGDFNDRGYVAYFWSSTEDEDDSSYAWYQFFNYYDGVYQYNDYKSLGFSVRCLRD